jgi:energy-coupling factor transport system permease protein
MIYRRLASPLHAARPAAGLGWCLALAAAGLVASSPLVLGAVLVAVLAGGAAAGIGADLRRALRLAVPLALTITVINALVVRDGLTTIWRFGGLPVLGQTNVTLEATVYGGVLGLRAAVLVLCGVLFSCAVDPDGLLRLLRRVSFRSALSATIATRMVPVLMRDSRRLADAQRCRYGPPAGRLALLRASSAGVFDRALDIAAALEVRGYGAARRAPRGGGRDPWSRHDLAFLGSAVALVLLSVLARASGWAPFHAYPALRLGMGVGAWAVSVGLVVVAVLPLADRRGVEPL